MTNLVSIVSRIARPPLPAVARSLAELGENIRLARLRRKLSASLVAERAGMTRPTLRAIERGDPGVTLGSYGNVLHSLGLEKDLAEVARDDELGRRLQDAALVPARARSRSKARTRDGR
jgi:transcriptional regulator with XRE-family HTH domain